MRASERLTRAMQTLDKMQRIVESLQQFQCTRYGERALLILRRELRDFRLFLHEITEKSEDHKCVPLVKKRCELLVRLVLVILSALFCKISLLSKAIDKRDINDNEYWTQFKAHKVSTTGSAERASQECWYFA